MNKPKELKENEFNHMLSVFIEDLKKMEEENDNNTLSSVDKYLKEKACEKKMEEIAKVMNSLDFGDKSRITNELKKSFDNGKNLYEKLMKIMSKTERQFDNEKRKKLKETINALEINNSDSLFNSFKEDSNRLGTERSVTVINSDKNEWTYKKGTLETEEIY